MFDIDRWQEIYNTIKKHKLRTALTAFGVFWGIFMLIVLLGAGKGLENGVMKNFDIAKNAVFVWATRTSKEYEGLKPGRVIMLTNDDVIAIREIQEVGVVAPRNQLGGNFTVNYKSKSASFEVNGEYPDYVKVKPTNIVNGRFVNDLDIKERRKICVIGKRVRDVLFGEGEDAVGKYLIIKGIHFQVVGMFKSNAKGEEAMREEQTIFMPSTTMQYSYNQVNRVGFLALTPKEGIAAEVIETKVKNLLKKRHQVHPDDERAFGSANVEKEFQQVQGLFLGISGFSWLVSIGTILAGVIGVGNIMLIVVKERTKEIGIRKALGATPISIISLIVQEAIVITALSGYVGLLLGVGLVEGINQLLIAFDAESGFFANPEINLTTAVSATIVLIVSGTIAGLIPALQAASVNPVEALRDE